MVVFSPTLENTPSTTDLFGGKTINQRRFDEHFGDVKKILLLMLPAVHTMKCAFFLCKIITKLQVKVCQPTDDYLGINFIKGSAI